MAAELQVAGGVIDAPQKLAIENEESALTISKGIQIK
jgi:hypothetical protein